MATDPISLACGKCKSEGIHITVTPYDYGVCGETGYEDAGEHADYYCRECGHSDEVEGGALRIYAPADEVAA
jgi:hypothetical protein